MSILKLYVVTSLFVLLFSGQVFADAVCDECMEQKAKDQTVSLNSSVNDVIKVAGKVDPFSSKAMAELCDSVRFLKNSKEDSNFYDFEYKMLSLAGVSDLYDATDEELKEKMSSLWKKHYKNFECKSETHIYSTGNYFRQLARIDGQDAFELLLDDYGFDPNIIDSDGCTALDYINIQLRRKVTYSKSQLIQFEKYKKIITSYGAKSANDIGGKCDVYGGAAL